MRAWDNGGSSLYGDACDEERNGGRDGTAHCQSRGVQNTNVHTCIALLSLELPFLFQIFFKGGGASVPRRSERRSPVRSKVTTASSLSLD